MPPAAAADANQHVTLEAAEADAIERAASRTISNARGGSAGFAPFSSIISISPGNRANTSRSSGMRVSPRAASPRRSVNP